MRDAPDRIWARPDYNECWLKKGEEEDELYHHDDKVKELEAQLAKVTAENTNLKRLWLDACSRSGESQYRAKDAEAAIPRAYRMALEDAGKHIFSLEHDGTKPEWVHQGAWAFTLEQAAGRASQTPTPADLVERAMKEKDNE